MTLIKRRVTPWVPAIVATAVLLWPSRAPGELLSSVSFDRQLKAGTGNNLGPEFAGTSLPQSGTATMSLPSGTSITATYQFYAPTEVNNQVDFRIDTSYLVFGTDLVGEQGANFDQVAVEFTTNQPLTFEFAFSNQAFGVNAVVAAMVVFNGPDLAIHDSGAPFIARGTNPQMNIPLTSGLLAANATYDVIILMEAAGLDSSSSLTGRSLFDLVLTPVPEPPAGLLLGLGAVIALICRRRWRRQAD